MKYTCVVLAAFLSFSSFAATPKFTKVLECTDYEIGTRVDEVNGELVSNEAIVTYSVRTKSLASMLEFKSDQAWGLAETKAPGFFTTHTANFFRKSNSPEMTVVAGDFHEKFTVDLNSTNQIVQVYIGKTPTRAMECVS